MFNAQEAHNLTLQVICEPIEEQIRMATSQGKFLIYVTELHTEAAKYFRELGYEVHWEADKAAFIYWYDK